MPSRSYLNTHIAGFAHWDGLDVLNELELGTELTLTVEFENPYDPQAVAIYFQDKKLGYIPATKNTDLFQFLAFGHMAIFEVRINRLNFEEHPEHQIGISVKIRDVREAE
jgi:hypothetical protein